MSKTRRAAIALLSALFACAGLVLVINGSAAAANLAANSGFEAGNLSGWT
jgi:hypothetical protein